MIRGTGCRKILALALVAASAATGVTSVTSTAHAEELKVTWGGKIQSDLRFRLVPVRVGNFWDGVELPAGIERNQNLLSAKVKAQFGRFAGVANVDMYLQPVTAKVKLQGFDELSKYNATQTFSFEPQSLYVEAKSLGLDGLDIRVGQQLVYWGAADQFNPTNNLNSDDLRDPLLFGKQVPNFMVKLDYWVTKSLSLSGVLVPVFRPALLPATANLASKDIQRMPFVNNQFRNRIESEFGFAAARGNGYPTVVDKLTPVLPETSAENMQFAYRIATQIAEQDIALSYYLGRTDFPQAFSNHTRQVDGKRCDPDKPSRCINGTLRTDVLLGYPKMHVFGLNAAGEFNPFKKISENIRGIGYRVEAALVVPKRSTIRLTQDALPALLQSGGEYDYDGDGKRGGKSAPEVVSDTPFLKWTVGLDYSFGSHVYTNVMWVHGLADEYGAGDWIHEGWQVRASGVNSQVGALLSSKCVVPKDGKMCASEVLLPKLGDYLVLGADFKFLEDAGLLRVFTIWSLSGVTMEGWNEEQQARDRRHYSLFSKQGFSAVIYPELDYNFGNGLELGAGALILLGRTYTKFGDPAAGGSQIFTRARYSF